MEADQDKSEKPTPHKLSEAKKKGQVSKSIELNAVIALTVFISLSYIFTFDIASKFQSIARTAFVGSYSLSNEPIVISRFVRDLFIESLAAILPCILVLVLVAVLSNVLQIGLIFTTFTLKFDVTKLNPAKNIKRIFSKKTLFELFKSILKVAGFASLVYFSMSYVLSVILPLPYTLPSQIKDVWVSIFFQLALWVLALLVIVSFIDFAYSKWDFTKQMMMSKKELKDEYKKREGDPEIKSKQKKVQKELLEKSASLSQVKNADVIITNPTHIAIALSYKSESMLAPKVIAMGKGDMATKIRSLGRTYQVPVVRNIPVARKLYRECQLNGYVPFDCYQDIAPVFRALLGMEEG